MTLQVLHDPLKASRKDVQDWATTKLHPNFNASFAECGMPFDSGSATLMGKALCLMEKGESNQSIEL